MKRLLFVLLLESSVISTNSVTHKLFHVEVTGTSFLIYSAPIKQFLVRWHLLLMYSSTLGEPGLGRILVFALIFFSQLIEVFRKRLVSLKVDVRESIGISKLFMMMRRVK